MRIEPLIPDAAPARPQREPQVDRVFGSLLDVLGSALGGAQQAEDAFAAGSGDLQHAIYERARADVALSVATAAAQRTAQALQAVFSMQV